MLDDLSAINDAGDVSVVDVFLDYCRDCDLSPKTIKDYQNKLKIYTDFLSNRRLDIMTATERDALAFIASLRNRQLAPATVKSYAVACKVLYTWLVKKKYISFSPFTSDVKVSSARRNERREKVVDASDLAKLFASLTESTTPFAKRDLAMITFLLDSGMRRGELLSIMFEALDLRRRRVVVKGKTGVRVVAFTELTAQRIKDYIATLSPPEPLKPDDIIWRDDNNNAVSETGFNSAIRRIESRSGVEFFAHQLRHTFGTLMSEQGVSLADIKELMGHASIRTTEQYVKPSNAHLAKVQKTYSPLAFIKTRRKSVKK